MLFCSCHIGGYFFFNHASNDGVAVWVARRLNDVWRQKRNVQAGRNKYYLRRSVEIFPWLNEHSLAIRLIRRATYTLPICYCDAMIENGTPDMTARNNIWPRQPSVLPMVLNPLKKNDSKTNGTVQSRSGIVYDFTSLSMPVDCNNKRRVARLSWSIHGWLPHLSPLSNGMKQLKEMIPRVGNIISFIF